MADENSPTFRQERDTFADANSRLQVEVNRLKLELLAYSSMKRAYSDLLTENELESLEEAIASTRAAVAC